MTITMYSLAPDVCRWCWATEKRFAHYGIEVEKVRVDENPDALGEIEGLGYRQAPVVVVKDESGSIIDHWGGYMETKIAALRNSA